MDTDTNMDIEYVQYTRKGKYKNNSFVKYINNSIIGKFYTPYSVKKINTSKRVRKQYRDILKPNHTNNKKKRKLITEGNNYNTLVELLNS
jgi:hypothetical protein